MKSAPPKTSEVTLFFQRTTNGVPVPMMVRYECDSTLPLLKAFKYSVSRMIEDKFSEKPEKHLRD